MLNDDTRTNLCTANDNNNDNLMQRYIAAVFYFSTGGEYWKNSYDFLSDNHECKWSNRMVCNDAKKIKEMIFGAFISYYSFTSDY